MRPSSLLPLLALVSSLGAQVDPALLAGLAARPIGPAGMSGRVAAIDALASDHPGVRVLYVHVEIDNASAIRAYEKARFVLESTEEPDCDADGIHRTRRALLYRDIPNLED